MPVYVLALTIPADTPEDEAVWEFVELEEEVLLSIDCFFPPGCFDLVRVQVYYGETQIAPKPPGAAFRGDGFKVTHPTWWRLPDSPTRLRVKGWNLDTQYQHTPLVFFTTQPLRLAVPVQLAWKVLRLLERLLGRILGPAAV